MFAHCVQGSVAILLFHNLSVVSSEAAPRVPNDLYRSEPLTFVTGTMGDNTSDRIVASQVSFIRSTYFPRSAVIADTSLAGAYSVDWPDNPVVYGGGHVNRLVSAVDSCLPLRVKSNLIRIGDLQLDGPEFQLIALVSERDGDCGHPAFLLLAGSGEPGIAEINNIRHGVNQVEIADRFGGWIWGHWEGAGEEIRFVADGQRPRIEWSEETLRGGEPGTSGNGAMVCYPAIIPPWNDVERVHGAITKGLAKAGEQLGVHAAAVRVYVYPDPKSMESLTGKKADAWVSVPAQSIHITIREQFDLDRVADTITHEAAHLYAFLSAGHPVSPLMGEGLAVWVSGQYGGMSLDEHATQLDFDKEQLIRMLSVDFRNYPESATYPLAGLMVGQLVDEFGLEAVLRDYYGTFPTEWRGDGATSAFYEETCGSLAARLKHRH